MCVYWTCQKQNLNLKVVFLLPSFMVSTVCFCFSVILLARWSVSSPVTTSWRLRRTHGLLILFTTEDISEELSSKPLLQPHIFSPWCSPESRFSSEGIQLEGLIWVHFILFKLNNISHFLGFFIIQLFQSFIFFFLIFLDFGNTTPPPPALHYTFAF